MAVELFPAVEPLLRGHVGSGDALDRDVRLRVFQLEPELLADDRPELEDRLVLAESVVLDLLAEREAAQQIGDILAVARSSARGT